MQPIYIDTSGVVRFRKNAIVKFLLDAGPFDMNQLAMMMWPDGDRTQFAQLIGYSVDGFCELSYVPDRTAERAQERAEQLLERVKNAKAARAAEEER